MDEKPKCSHDVDPITQQPTQKDQSAAQEDQTAQKEEAPATKIHTVLTKESPGYLEDLSTVPITVITIDKTIYSIEQPALLKDQSVYLKEELPHPKDQPAAYPKDQPAAYSKIQNAFSEDQPAAYSKIQNSLTIDQPAVTKEETSFPKIHIALRKIKSSSSEEQTASSTIHIYSTKDESCSSKEQTVVEKIHTCPSKNNSASPRQLTITPKIQTASTIHEAAMSATPKNLVDALLENYSKKFEKGISLCATRASATRSCNINGGYISSNAPLKISSSTQSSVTTQPVAQLPLAAPVTVTGQPSSLFLQALAKLNESSLTLAVISHFRLQSSSNLSKVYKIESGEITPPDSLTSAPPTYSFVLRQLAVRRRPRFMGTFFPSPSFVQQAPPPTYTGAFDVYIEPALPPAPARVYTFGFTSMPIVCPECGYTGMTVVTSHVTICTHLCAFILCLLCCWLCAPLPYILRSCKDVYHYCRNCRSFLGMYCPTNPESAVYPNVTVI